MIIAYYNCTCTCVYIYTHIYDHPGVDSTCLLNQNHPIKWSCLKVTYSIWYIPGCYLWIDYSNLTATSLEWLVLGQGKPWLFWNKQTEAVKSVIPKKVMNRALVPWFPTLLSWLSDWVPAGKKTADFSFGTGLMFNGGLDPAPSNGITVSYHHISLGLMERTAWSFPPVW